MRPTNVIPIDPLSDRSLRLSEVVKAMLPDTLLLQTAEESLDDPVLLRRIGRDELLRQPIVPTSSPESPALEDQPVVASHDRRAARRSERAEASDTRLLDRSFGLLRSTTQGELPAQQLPIMAVDDADQVRPPISTTVHMRHVHRPAAITAAGTAC
jgi:hypothetical protein